MADQPSSICALCERTVPRLTRHHLIPRKRHRAPAMLKRWSKTEMRERIAWLCSPCHKQIHALLDEKSLAADYHSIDLLRAHPDIQRFVEWIRDKPGSTQVIVHKRSKTP